MTSPAPLPAGWLGRLVGTWTTRTATTDDSEHPGYTATGIETVRAISDAFVLAESHGTGSDGGANRAAILLGHDPATSRITGAYAGTETPALFVYEGQVGEDGAVQLDTEGPAQGEGRATDRYRDTIRFLDDDTREQVSQVLGADGAWTPFLRITATRQAGRKSEEA